MTEARQALECTFATHDGVDLFYRHWPSTAPRRGCVVMFHRGHEHSGRIAHLVDELDLPEFDVFAWDARGHGRSPGVRGYSPSFATSVRDVQTFIDHIHATYGIAHEDMAVLAQSVGAVLVATWAHDYAPKVRCLVLASPAFKVKLYVPFARAGLRLMQAVRGNFAALVQRAFHCKRAALPGSGLLPVWRARPGWPDGGHGRGGSVAVVGGRLHSVWWR